MATLGLSINKYYVRKDGSLRIRVTLNHNDSTCYINTPYTIDSEKHWANGKVVRTSDAATLNSKLRKILDKYQETLNNIPNIKVISCKQLKDQILRRCNGEASITLHKCADEYIQLVSQDKSADYASMLSLSLRYLDKCFGDDILLNEISTTDVSVFKEWLRKNTKAGKSTTSKYLSHFKVFLNYGIRMQYVRFAVHPFVDTRISRSDVRENEDLSLQSFIAIRDVVLENKRDNIARDLFLLSFYLGGINLVDLINAELKDADELEYIREKIRSRAQVKVCIPILPEAKAIIDKYIVKDSTRLNFGLHGSYKTFRRYIGVGIKEIATKCGIREDLTFYSARKTFAQFASDLGIPNGVIDYCIGHSPKSNGVIAHYIKFRKHQAAFAIKRVVDYTNNPDNYKEFVELKKDIMVSKF